MAALAHDPVIGLALRAGLALLFASAAMHKLRDSRAFVSVLHAYRLLPSIMVAATARAVAGVELVVATALLVPATLTIGAAGAIGLLAVYSAAIAINLWRGRREIDCGCGAPGTRQPITPWLLVRNACVALAAWAAVRPIALRPLVWADWLTVVGILAVAAATWTAAHGLAAASHRVRAFGAAR